MKVLMVLDNVADVQLTMHLIVDLSFELPVASMILTLTTAEL